MGIRDISQDDDRMRTWIALKSIYVWINNDYEIRIVGLVILHKEI